VVPFGLPGKQKERPPGQVSKSSKPIFRSLVSQQSYSPADFYFHSGIFSRPAWLSQMNPRRSLSGQWNADLTG